MIFAAVGTVHGFDRLVRMLDEWAASHDEPVLAQIGVTAFEPSHCEWFRFGSPDVLAKHIEDARAVVTHAGVGMVIDVLERGRKLVVVPRVRRLREHIDDHQTELAEVLSREGLAAVASGYDELSQALADPEPPMMRASRRDELATAVAAVLRDWDLTARTR